MSPRFYEFGPYRLDTGRCLLERDGAGVPLTPKAFDLLLALIECHGEIISKGELMQRVWRDSFVEDGNLTYNISVLRKALGERAGEHQYIITAPGQGYRFAAEVKAIGSGPEAVVAETTPAVSLPLQNILPKRTVMIAALSGVSIILSLFIYRVVTPLKPTPEAATNSPIKSIAVLPFKPLNGDSDDERLCLGM